MCCRSVEKRAQEWVKARVGFLLKVRMTIPASPPGPGGLLRATRSLRLDSERGEFAFREGGDFDPTGKSGGIVISCLAPLEKIFRFPPDANHFTDSHRLVPLEGRIAIVTERGAGCGGRGSVRRCQGMAGRVDT